MYCDFFLYKKKKRGGENIKRIALKVEEKGTSQFLTSGLSWFIRARGPATGVNMIFFLFKER